MKKQQEAQKTYSYTTITSASKLKKSHLDFSNFQSSCAITQHKSVGDIGYQQLRKKNANFKYNCLEQILSKLYLRRKMFTFQVLKQFFLFPDESISQNISIDTYDRILFNDQPIHTLVKIYETKEMQDKIWAFLNLKALRLRKKLEIFSAEIQKVQGSVQKRYKADVFSQIHSYSIRILPIRQKQSNEVHKNTIITRSKEEREIKIKSPEIIRIKASQPNIRKIQPYAERARVIYPTEQNSTKRQSYPYDRASQIKTQKISYQRPSNHQRSMNCSGGNTSIHIYGCCQVQRNCCSCHCYNNSIIQSCSCTQNICCNHCQRNLLKGNGYSMDQRIQYLKKLEQMFEKMEKNSKN